MRKYLRGRQFWGKNYLLKTELLCRSLKEKLAAILLGLVSKTSFMGPGLENLNIVYFNHVQMFPIFYYFFPFICYLKKIPVFEKSVNHLILPSFTPRQDETIWGFMTYGSDVAFTREENLCKVQSLHKKWRFPLSISSLNVTKSTGNYGFGHIYSRNP